MSLVREKGIALALAFLAALWASPLFGHEGEQSFLDLPVTSGFDAASVPQGQDPLEARLAYAVQRAGVLTTPAGETLLPPGTTFDALSFDDAATAHLSITFARGVELTPWPESHVAAINTVFRSILSAERPISGLEIQFRETTEIGPGGYRPLGSLMVTPPAEPNLELNDPDQYIIRQSWSAVGLPALAGPVANADGQPAGALSGVVVFCSGGHGWTAGSSSWSLQRPLLLNMNEDYGNLEQLNYLVEYLYNAGATVVPFRPVGYQKVEVVLDNDDPGVTWTGTWNNSTTGQYYYENGVTTSGVPYRWSAANATETAVARYTPNLPKADFYPVYCWTKHDSDRVPQTYRIHHSGGTAQVLIDHSRVGNGWTWLGNFYFEQGTGGYVEISNKSTVSGSIIADAIRFGNGMGDLVGAGPKKISGYPREEECQRYWAESELGQNAVGFSSSIWDCCSLDSDDNVGTGARWAREMNRTDINNDRWRRIYIEYHSNASGGTAKGTVGLYNLDTGATTYQLELATLLGEKIEADMLALDGGFEYAWGSRNPNTYHADFDYGAISAAATGNEFDATILEVAFHDNAEDAANLRNAKVRDAIARSTVQGLIDFLGNGTRFPGTQVQLVYPPDAPQRVQVVQDGHDNVVISWTPGPTRATTPASGDAATGYKIYRSANGYGFGNAVTVANVTSLVLSDVPTDTTVYFRVAATNAGGESMPSPTLAVRRPATGKARVLIVDGFDRVSRQQNYIQNIPAGAMERPIARRVNSFDYIVQHAGAIAAAGRSFDSCRHEAVTAGGVALAGYSAVVWISGEESTADKTFDSTEQSLLTTYLNGGGRLFASGSEIAYELDGNAAGRPFYENLLHANYVGDSAGTYVVTGTGGILADVGAFDFNPANGAVYDVGAADRIAPLNGALPILSYTGGTADTAGIQYDSGVYRVVAFGFPFEVISSSTARNAVMLRVMDYLSPLLPTCVPRADFDCDGDVDLSDFGHLQVCMSGMVRQADPACANALLNDDPYVNQTDMAIFINCLTGENIPADPDCMGPL